MTSEIDTQQLRDFIVWARANGVRSFSSPSFSFELSPPEPEIQAEPIEQAEQKRFSDDELDLLSA